MENFITVFIIILIVLGSVAKKIALKQTKKRGDDPRAADGWLSKLNAFIKDIQQQIETQQPQESPTDANQWRELMEEDAPSRRHRVVMDDISIEDEFEVNDHPEHRPSKRQPEAKPMPSPRRSARPETPPSNAIEDLRMPLLGSTMGASNLQRAVIWYEILGRPVALKGPVGDRF